MFGGGKGGKGGGKGKGGGFGVSGHAARSIRGDQLTVLLWQGGPPPNVAPANEIREHKLYVGGLDPRVNEAMIIKLFRPHGKIVREQFMWHNHGPRRGEPRGYCFVEYSKREEAVRAKNALDGNRLCGRSLSVRFVEEKAGSYGEDASYEKAFSITGMGTHGSSAPGGAAAAAAPSTEGEGGEAAEHAAETSLDRKMAVLRQVSTLA
jgi:hypothetical protein